MSIQRTCVHILLASWIRRVCRWICHINWRLLWEYSPTNWRHTDQPATSPVCKMPYFVAHVGLVGLQGVLSNFYSIPCGVMWWVCLFVCLSVCPHAYLSNQTSKLHHIFCNFCGCGMVRRRRFNILCTSVFVDDVMFFYNRRYGGVQLRQQQPRCIACTAIHPCCVVLVTSYCMVDGRRQD